MRTSPLILSKRFLFIIVCAAVMLTDCSQKTQKIKSSFSQNPPLSLKVRQVPQFIVFGFDDNGFSGLDNSGGTGGVKFIIDLFSSRSNPSGKGNRQTYDGAQIHFSMYCTTSYIDGLGTENPVFIKRVWREALLKGNEVGVHTHQHKHGVQLSLQEWESEIQKCMDWLTKPYDPDESLNAPDTSKGIGMLPSEIYGFRTPYLEYNDHAFQAVFRKGFLYDCSIEEGFQDDQDGTNFLWPYTLDNGSPGDKISALEHQRKPISAYPGLWEIPGYAVIVPPDDQCRKYGVEPGFRSRMKKAQEYFDKNSGKITGFDWNLWIEFGMTGDEFLATLKYTLDLRLEGNRCPMTFGTHSDIYSSKFQDLINSNVVERQQALKEFIDYALTIPEVRIVSTKELLDWIMNPSSL
jgi:peptidoglycan/xylan/chitin deacetylase (PgdA/CDA1 family)